MKENVLESFLVNLQIGITQLHYELTSSQIIFRYFLVNKGLGMVTSYSYIKCWESTLEVIFKLCMVVEIFQLAHEISSFPEVLYKSGLLKNLSKFINKHKM